MASEFRNVDYVTENGMIGGEKNLDDRLSRFDIISDRDRQMDGRRPGNSLYRAYVQHRAGKNW